MSLTINPKFQEAKNNPKHKKGERTTPRHTKTEQLKISDGDKRNPKGSQKEERHYIYIEEKNDNKLYTGHNASQKTVGNISSLEFYFQQKYLKKKGKIKISDIQKWEPFITSRQALNEILKGSPPGRRKMIPIRNLDEYKGIKNKRNGNYTKTKILCPYYLNHFKR